MEDYLVYNDYVKKFNFSRPSYHLKITLLSDLVCIVPC